MTEPKHLPHEDQKPVREQARKPPKEPALVSSIDGEPDPLVQVLIALKRERELSADRQRKNEQLSVLSRCQQEKIQEMEPKAAYYDALVASPSSLTSFRETAKLLGIREKMFTQWLQNHRYCFRSAHGRLLPYADKLCEGLFAVREVAYGRAPDGEMRTAVYAKITPKGRAELFRKMRELS